MKRKRKFKVLEKDLTSPFQSMKYEIGKRYVCDDFDADHANLCSSGFYATDIEGLLYSYNCNRSIFECLVGGKSVEIDQFKQRYSTIEIVREVSEDEIKSLIVKNGLCNKLGYDIEEAIFPINPLKIHNVDISEIHKDNLKQWASVRYSVGDSVRNSVGDSVWDSVRNSVWDSVRYSVWDSVRYSVRNSVWAYMSSLFPNIKQYHEPGTNPFQSCIDLWKSGLVPSYDGGMWRLHSGEAAKIIYKIKY